MLLYEYKTLIQYSSQYCKSKLKVEQEINWNYTLLFKHNNTMSLQIFV
jgi:hypothetical protein